jgi:hypothetical protein
MGFSWTHNDGYTYKSGHWIITAKEYNGILKWAIYKDGDEVATRRNLSNARDYAEKQE